ncbi:MAG: sodium:solute symporter [Eubacteriales bacterium]|nr:sodium:solute symporter [Eubacteriales bacterium]
MKVTVVQILIFLAFFASMLVIGLISRKRIRNSSEFMSGAKHVGGWMAAFAYGTTYFSAVVFIGYGGSVSWKYGIASIWIGIANALIGTLLAWLLLGKRSYTAMHALNVDTMSQYFEKKFGSRALRIVSAIVTFLFLIPYSCGVYTGLGILFRSVFGIPEWALILVMGLLTALYLVLGGYLAAAVNDLIQGIVMLVGITAVVLMVVTNGSIGGFSGGMSSLAAQNAALADPFAINFDLICLIVMTSFGTWGLPQMAHKFHAVKDAGQIRKATVVSTIFALIIGGGCYLMGSFGRVYMNGVMPEGGGDYVVPAMLDIVLGGESVASQALYAVIAIAVLSASMSTLSSLVLTSSGAVALDLTKGVLKPDISPKKLMTLLRGLCVVFIAVSIALTLKRIDAIVNLMSYSWGALAGAFGGPYVLSLFSKHINKYGAWASLVLAVGLTVAGLFGLFGPVSAVNIGAFAIAGSFVITPIASLIGEKLDKSLVVD